MSLDDFMRAMWRTYGKPGGSREGYVDHPYTIADAEATLAEVSGDRAFARDFFARYIQGHDVADYARLLAARRLRRAQAQPGTRVARRPAPRIARRRARRALVAPTWPIYAAGLDQDDELQQVDGQRINGDGDVAAVLQRHKPGDTVPIVFVDRTGVAKTASVTLAEDPHIEVVPVETARRADAGAESVSRSLAGAEIDACSLAATHRRGARRRQFRARPKAPAATDEQLQQQQLEAGARVPGGLEARLAGVVVAALKEAFDRDSRRLELEREQLAAERQRAERALRLELQRQAGDREIGRLRLLAGVAVAAWIGDAVAVVAARRAPASARALALGGGWLLLLAAIAASFIAQSRVAGALTRVADSGARGAMITSGASGALALWLSVFGLALVALAVLIA